MMKKLLALLLCLTLLPLYALGAMTEDERLAYSLQLFEDFRAVNEEKVLQDMTEEMVNYLKGKVGMVWMQIQTQAGAFEKIGEQKDYEKNGFYVTETGLYFKNMYLVQTVTFTQDGQVAGLLYTPATKPENVVEATLPEGLIERDITVMADEAYPLPGTLTLPKGDILAGFVLVQGSGPNDRDESIGANKPFRDLAWGLAQRGFAVLRYDKRTLTHGAKMEKAPDFEKLTVDEETALDAAAAVRLLQSQPELEGKKVFLLGHSMGGMLASYVGSKTPEASGYVLLAGTPRKLWEIIAEQNELILAELPEEQATPLRLNLKEEIKKAEALLTLSDEDALKQENAPFTISAWYLRHWEQIDAAKLHMADQKPVLVLQGEGDRQVYMKDFELWKEALKGHPDAVFKSYPGLNHLFGKYKGEQVPMSQLMTVEYMQPTPVPEEVIQDIADWASERL